MAQQIGDRLTLRATVAERVHLGGDHNLRLVAEDGASFWLTESALASFIAPEKRPTADVGVKGLIAGTKPLPATPPPKAPAPRKVSER